jgi:hypothetical protein
MIQECGVFSHVAKFLGSPRDYTRLRTTCEGAYAALPKRMDVSPHVFLAIVALWLKSPYYLWRRAATTMLPRKLRIVSKIDASLLLTLCRLELMSTINECFEDGFISPDVLHDLDTDGRIRIIDWGLENAKIPLVRAASPGAVNLRAVAADPLETLILEELASGNILPRDEAIIPEWLDFKVDTAWEVTSDAGLAAELMRRFPARNLHSTIKIPGKGR